MRLYEPGAAFCPQPGVVVAGAEAIREALTGFRALRPRLTGRIASGVSADVLALVHNDWALRGAGPDGAPVEMAGRSLDVVRRQPDGGWLVVVDNPWGGTGEPAAPGDGPSVP